MRAVFLALTLGAISMTAAEIEAQEKKDEGPQEPFKQRVTLIGTSETRTPVKDVDAYQYEGKKDKKQYFGVRAKGPHSLAGFGGPLPPKSGIIDKDGVTWEVVRVIGTGPTDNVRHFEVVKKAEPKKE